jgi:ring-1,2-phenylacetyl-CoA epoxidase subunit PaaD
MVTREVTPEAIPEVILAMTGETATALSADASAGACPTADAADALLAHAAALAASVPDPEIPVITLGDLGIVRSVHREAGCVVVTITPTYTGCPATEVIADDVRQILREHGFVDAQVRLTLSPPWTTDWITETGRERLRAYGIAPPGRGAAAQEAVMRFMPRSRQAAPLAGSAQADQDAPITCPNCGSNATEQLSAYGSTPCKAIHRCLACREPFDYFKPY